MTLGAGTSCGSSGAAFSFSQTEVNCVFLPPAVREKSSLCLMLWDSGWSRTKPSLLALLSTSD